MIDLAHTIGLKYNYFNKGVIVGAKLNLIGKKFNRLLVLEEDFSKKRTAYKCVCDCGQITIVTTYNLTSNKTKSCGCLNKEHQKSFGSNYGYKPVHGMTKTPTWVTWDSMVYRCTKKGNRQYSTYGGMLCEEWKDFKNFLRDMGERPHGKTLDRINVYKGYSKENCRWATPREQQNNKTNTRYLLINENVISLMDLAREFEIKKSAAQYFYSVLKKIGDNKVQIWNF